MRSAKLCGTESLSSEAHTGSVLTRRFMLGMNFVFGLPSDEEAPGAGVPLPSLLRLNSEPLVYEPPKPGRESDEPLVLPGGAVPILPRVAELLAAGGPGRVDPIAELEEPLGAPPSACGSALALTALPAPEAELVLAAGASRTASALAKLLSRDGAGVADSLRTDSAAAEAAAAPLPRPRPRPRPRGAAESDITCKRQASTLPLRRTTHSPAQSQQKRKRERMFASTRTACSSAATAAARPRTASALLGRFFARELPSALSNPAASTSASSSVERGATNNAAAETSEATEVELTPGMWDDVRNPFLPSRQEARQRSMTPARYSLRRQKALRVAAASLGLPEWALPPSPLQRASDDSSKSKRSDKRSLIVPTPHVPESSVLAHLALRKTGPYKGRPGNAFKGALHERRRSARQATLDNAMAAHEKRLANFKAVRG